VRIDFAAERGRTRVLEEGIFGVHGVHVEWDMAFLRLQEKVDWADPLRLAATDHISADRPVCVIGYPWRDSRNEPEDVLRVFGDEFGVKRISPGFVIQSDDGGYLTHNCSTLAGNSGSCVLDLESGVVLALHVAGLYGQVNWAIPTHHLAGAEDLRRWGASFV
jgi:endonuclease G